jgi:hypothetical protein
VQIRLGSQLRRECEPLMTMPEARGRGRRRTTGHQGSSTLKGPPARKYLYDFDVVDADKLATGT